MKVPGPINPVLTGGALVSNPSAQASPDFADLVATPDSATMQAAGGEDAEGIYDAAKQFEAYFVQQLFSVMRQSIPKDGLFERGYSNDVYEGMLDQEYAKGIAESGGIGLADVLAKQLLDAAGLEGEGVESGGSVNYDAPAE